MSKREMMMPQPSPGASAPAQPIPSGRPRTVSSPIPVQSPPGSSRPLSPGEYITGIQPGFNMLLKPSNGLVSEPRSQTIVGRAGVEFCVSKSHIPQSASLAHKNKVFGTGDCLTSQ